MLVVQIKTASVMTKIYIISLYVFVSEAKNHVTNNKFSLMSKCVSTTDVPLLFLFFKASWPKGRQGPKLSGLGIFWAELSHLTLIIIIFFIISRWILYHICYGSSFFYVREFDCLKDRICWYCETKFHIAWRKKV